MIDSDTASTSGRVIRMPRPVDALARPFAAASESLRARSSGHVELLAEIPL